MLKVRTKPQTEGEEPREGLALAMHPVPRDSAAGGELHGIEYLLLVVLDGDPELREFWSDELEFVGIAVPQAPPGGLVRGLPPSPGGRGGY